MGRRKMSVSQPLAATTIPDAREPHRELTLRAVLTALVVAALMGASYPYVVLKLGYGPNISVVSAFFGYIILSLVELSPAHGEHAGRTI